MSAQMDGEPPGVTEAVLDAHIHQCAECRDWREQAFEVGRRVRMTGWSQPTDLTETIVSDLSWTQPARRSRRDRVAAWSGPLRVVLLVAAAAGQLALTVPLLMDSGGGGMSTDMHGMHELGVFDFALGVAFLAGALRPRLAAGMAWPCCAAAFGLLATSAIDVIGHHTFETHELRHLIAVAGAALLCWTARVTGRPEPADLARGREVQTAQTGGATDRDGGPPVPVSVSTRGAA